MKVTTKGQVTIPQEIRHRLNIYPGADVRFEIDGEAIKLIPAKPMADEEPLFIQRMRGRATVKISTDEILALTRGE